MLSTQEVIQKIAINNPDKIFDYDFFKEECNLQKVPIVLIHHYATIATLTRMAHLKYPELSLDQAYNKLTEIPIITTEVYANAIESTKSSCGGCGGGTVL